MKIKVDELKSVTKKALQKYGYNSEETKTILDVLMYAQLRGNNQGVVKLIGNGIPKSSEAGKIKAIKETKLSTLLDGNYNQGMVVLTQAVDTAIKKAKEHGFGIAGTYNTCTSTGALGYYAQKIAKEDLIGFVYAGSPETVCAFGSYQPIFGTNPMAIGVPTDNTPFVLDIATAYMAYFGLVEAKTAGKKIPAGIAYDKDGNMTTDPGEAMEGALLPFDLRYKGSGLSMMVEVLTGPLVRASFTGVGDTAKNWGNLVYAFDPELLTSASEFKTQVSTMIQKVKATKKLPGVEEVLVAGERGDRIYQKAIESGETEIEENLWNELQKVTI